MTVAWFDLLARCGVSLETLGEALYDTDRAGMGRNTPAPWRVAGDEVRLRYRRLARAAVDRLGPLDDELLTRLLDDEGVLREQLRQQARRIKELEGRIEREAP
jgi:hypothetical protein